MPQSWKILFDNGSSNPPTGISYSNGFKFKGVLTPNHYPDYGVITDPEDKLVYEGKIERDIYGYFQIYIEKGRTLNSYGL